MQLEESGNAKDVPPLSCRGFLALSTFIADRVVLSGHKRRTNRSFQRGMDARKARLEGSHEVPV